MSGIRVLVVDDSAFARKVVRELLSSDPGIEVVGIARDGLEALEKIAELRPDVVTLDLLMPDLDGLGVLRGLPEDASCQVIVVSVSGSETEIAIEALHLGAVDLVTKPTTLPTDRLYAMASDLVAKVKAAARARPRRAADIATAGAPSVIVPRGNAPAARLVVLGTSTGGPQAISTLFKTLPHDLPACLAIALHIPAGYTTPLAERITRMGGLPLDEAIDGMELRPGRAVIAPGGMHLRVREADGRIFAVVSREPLDTIHHPSVNVLFESAAEQLGAAVIGIVLTGMGDDGLQGAQAIRRAGGRVFAESAASCVVYGMPRVVIEGGLASGEVTLDRMVALIVDQLG